MKKLLINFYGQLWDIIFYIKNDLIAAKLMKVPVVLDEDKIVERICQNKASMCRFGDGEFSLMRGENLKFQKYNEKIAKELNEIIRSNNEDVLICIPDIFGSLQRYTLKVQRYWKKYLHKNRKNIYSLLKKIKHIIML